MSGTSIDAIDSAIVECQEGGVMLAGTHAHPIADKVRQEIVALSQPGDNEIERMGQLDRKLGFLFAEATRQLLDKHSIGPGEITAIGSHGQTVRHIPRSSADSQGMGFTLQIGDPNTIAELTGITTVADFRRRDIAADGEGAPLAPAFHAAALSRPGTNRAIVNIGGIANVSLLEGERLMEGFDTGPGNTLLDQWHARHCSGAIDDRGKWAASGMVHRGLLDKLLNHPFFEQQGPRSTGKEAFNLDWLEAVLEDFPQIAANDIQSTLAELTAASISKTILGSPKSFDEIYICGGGAHNDHLMSRLESMLSPAIVASTGEAGIDPDWVEAMTFAWLAQQTLINRPGNAPQVTGANGPRILGAIYRA